jgi:hypothetical protein
MEAALDEGRYTDKDLIEIKVAMHLPYQPANNEYERISGQLAANGKHYNYVKRKISPDTIYFYCIPNRLANQLAFAKNQYSKQANDLPNSQKEKDIAKKGGTAFQYRDAIPDYIIAAPVSLAENAYSNITYLLSSLPAATPYQPPEV